MSDNKSKNVKIENNSEDKTGETKKTTISLFYRILIPIIVIIYLILVNSYFDNYKKDFSWGMVVKIKTKKSLFDGKQQWDFLNH